MRLPCELWMWSGRIRQPERGAGTWRETLALPSEASAIAKLLRVASPSLQAQPQSRYWLKPVTVSNVEALLLNA